MSNKLDIKFDYSLFFYYLALQAGRYTCALVMTRLTCMLPGGGGGLSGTEGGHTQVTHFAEERVFFKIW